MSPRRIWAQFWRRSTAEAFCSVDIAGRPPEILVDVSVLYRQDVGTGIQRVVRSLVLALEVRAVEGHRVRPIYAARRRAYRYADPDFLRKGGGDRVEPGEPLRPQPGDIFVKDRSLTGPPPGLRSERPISLRIYLDIWQAATDFDRSGGYMLMRCGR